MKNVFITGVSSGIGKDAVRYLLAKSFNIYASVRNETDKVELLKEFPQNLKIYLFDVCNTDDIQSAKEEFIRDLDGEQLHVLVNNAGFAQPGPLIHISDSDFRKQIEVNVFGVRNVTNALLPLLGADLKTKFKPGKIINISSISGLFNTPMMGTYCISKHALESMSEVYRRELMIYGIDVVCINPGPVLSKIWDKNLGKLDQYADTDYRKIIAKADKIIEISKNEALPLAKISEVIYNTILSKKPPINRIVHKNKFGFSLIKSLPKRWVDRIMFKRLMNEDVVKIR